MKKIFVLLAVLAFVACSDSEPVLSDDSVGMRILYSGFDSSVKVFVYEGHDYILAQCVYGVSLCHSESCPCKSK